MRQDSDLASSFLLSLAVHLSVVLIAQAVLFSIRTAEIPSFEPLPILILPAVGPAPGALGDGLPPPPALGVPAEPAPAAKPQVAKVEPVRKTRPARRPPPRAKSAVVVPPPPVVAAVPEPVAPAPPPSVPVPPEAPAGTATAPGRGTNQVVGIPGGWQLSGDGRSWQRRRVYGTGGGGGYGSGGRGRFIAPDAPGYFGRLLGQVSMRSAHDHDSYYGRVFLFPKDGRDYSDRTLFGYSFRENFAGGGFREFQVGRVQTHGAYLMVTDLFSDGRHSTMGHTVIIPFPRVNKPAFRVNELGGGDFRLAAPGGAALDFNGRNGHLISTRGFSVLPQGEIGSPPRVAYRGAHVRIQSVGGNPFLKGRGAMVYDGRGGQCALTTTDLFSHRGTNESDMFRFATDNELYAFLNDRCPWLNVPRGTRTQVAKAAPAKKSSRTASSSPSDAKGLIPALFDAFR